MEQSFMKAAICKAYGPPETVVVKQIPKPKIKAGDVLIKVMASTVNSGDVRMRGLKVDGWMKLAMRLVLGFSGPRKSVLGVTFAGVVEQVGANVSRFKPGDRLFGLTGFKFGAHAEYLCIPEGATMVGMPAGAGFEAAAALPFGAHTAIHFLQAAGMEQLDRPKVMIYGASGSVGCAALQIAAHYGAILTAVCSSRSSSALAPFPIDNIILYDKTDVTKTTEKFDIIFDAVGKLSKKQCRSLLSPKGKFVTVGGLAVAREKTEQLVLVRELFEAGKYRPMIDKTFLLEEIVAAHQYVDTGRKIGNVVLRIAQEQDVI